MLRYEESTGGETLRKAEQVARRRPSGGPGWWLGVQAPAVPGQGFELWWAGHVAGQYPPPRSRLEPLWQVECGSELNSEDVFILDCDSAVYQFNGSKASAQKRGRAREVAWLAPAQGGGAMAGRRRIGSWRMIGMGG